MALDSGVAVDGIAMALLTKVPGSIVVIIYVLRDNECVQCFMQDLEHGL